MATPSKTSSTFLWDQWLHRLSGPASVNREPARLEALKMLNRNAELKAGQERRLGQLLLEATEAEALVLLRKAPSKPPRVELTTLSRGQVANLLKDSAFSGGRVMSARHGGRLKRPIRSPKHDEPLTAFINFEIESGWVVSLLMASGPAKADQAFLELAELTIANRQLRRGLADALRSENDRLANLTHQLSEGLVILNAALKIEVWNRPLQRLTGYSPLEAEHQPYGAFLQRPGLSGWLETLIAEPATQGIFHEEIEILTKNKGRKWVHIAGSFLRGSDGAINQTIILISDISHHKELEERKNEFISIATHELRTPITAIKGYLSLLQKTTVNPSPKQQAYLNRALEANDRLISLTEDLLQVIHVEENRVQFSLRPVNVLPIVRQAATDFTDKAQHKGLSIHFTTPAFAAVVMADPQRLEQVFTNLIDNAIKYTARGQITIRFSQHVEKLTKEKLVAISIIDTGLGLSDKEITTIFEKFHRTDGARASSESGAGLGLFIVKSFIEKQGGRITVSSRPRRGSEFTVLFPTVEPNAFVKIND